MLSPQEFISQEREIREAIKYQESKQGKFRLPDDDFRDCYDVLKHAIRSCEKPPDYLCAAAFYRYCLAVIKITTVFNSQNKQKTRQEKLDRLIAKKFQKKPDSPLLFCLVQAYAETVLESEVSFIFRLQKEIIEAFVKLLEYHTSVNLVVSHHNLERLFYSLARIILWGKIGSGVREILKRNIEKISCSLLSPNSGLDGCELRRLVIPLVLLVIAYDSVYSDCLTNTIMRKKTLPIFCATLRQDQWVTSDETPTMITSKIDLDKCILSHITKAPHRMKHHSPMDMFTHSFLILNQNVVTRLIRLVCSSDVPVPIAKRLADIFRTIAASTRDFSYIDDSAEDQDTKSTRMSAKTPHQQLMEMLKMVIPSVGKTNTIQSRLVICSALQEQPKAFEQLFYSVYEDFNNNPALALGANLIHFFDDQGHLEELSSVVSHMLEDGPNFVKRVLSDETLPCERELMELRLFDMFKHIGSSLPKRTWCDLMVSYLRAFKQTFERLVSQSCIYATSGGSRSVPHIFKIWTLSDERKLLLLTSLAKIAGILKPLRKEPKADRLTFMESLLSFSDTGLDVVTFYIAVLMQEPLGSDNNTWLRCLKGTVIRLFDISDTTTLSLGQRNIVADGIIPYVQGELRARLQGCESFLKLLSLNEATVMNAFSRLENREVLYIWTMYKLEGERMRGIFSFSKLIDVANGQPAISEDKLRKYMDKQRRLIRDIPLILCKYFYTIPSFSTNSDKRTNFAKFLTDGLQTPVKCLRIVISFSLFIDWTKNIKAAISLSHCAQCAYCAFIDACCKMVRNVLRTDGVGAMSLLILKYLGDGEESLLSIPPTRFFNTIKSVRREVRHLKDECVVGGCEDYSGLGIAETQVKDLMVIKKKLKKRHHDTYNILYQSFVETCSIKPFVGTTVNREAKFNTFGNPMNIDNVLSGGMSPCECIDKLDSRVGRSHFAEFDILHKLASSYPSEVEQKKALGQFFLAFRDIIYYNSGAQTTAEQLPFWDLEVLSSNTSDFALRVRMVVILCVKNAVHICKHAALSVPLFRDVVATSVNFIETNIIHCTAAHRQTVMRKLSKGGLCTLFLFVAAVFNEVLSFVTNSHIHTTKGAAKLLTRERINRASICIQSVVMLNITEHIRTAGSAPGFMRVVRQIARRLIETNNQTVSFECGSPSLRLSSARRDNRCIPITHGVDPSFERIFIRISEPDVELDPYVSGALVSSAPRVSSVIDFSMFDNQHFDVAVINRALQELVDISFPFCASNSEIATLAVDNSQVFTVPRLREGSVVRLLTIELLESLAVTGAGSTASVSRSCIFDVVNECPLLFYETLLSGDVASASSGFSLGPELLSPLSLESAVTVLHSNRSSPWRHAAYVALLNSGRDATLFIPQIIQSLRFDVSKEAVPYAARALRDLAHQTIEGEETGNEQAISMLLGLRTEAGRAVSVRSSGAATSKAASARASTGSGPERSGRTAERLDEATHPASNREHQQETNDDEAAFMRRCAELHDEVLLQLGDKREEILRCLMLVDEFLKCSNALIDVSRKNRQARLEEMVENISLEGVSFLPFDTHLKPLKIIGCNSLKSHAKVPILIRFECVHADEVMSPCPSKIVKSYIFKTHDDIRQDQLFMQVASYSRRMFKYYGIPAMLKPYICMPTGCEDGIIEAVPNSTSRDEIGNLTEGKLLDYFSRRHGGIGSEPFQRARLKFISSLSAYSILTYLMQVKDRHNGNILILDNGAIVHIDFGFILDIAPGGKLSLERPPFKLTQEMLDVLGGTTDCDGFILFMRLCMQVFLMLRLRGPTVLALVDAMSKSGLPCFTSSTIANLRRRFEPGLSTPETIIHVDSFVRSSVKRLASVVYDKFQAAQNNINH